MLQKYFQWVRENEAQATSLERMTRTMSYIFADPSNLVSMEAMWTASKLHALSNQIIVATKHNTSTKHIVGYVLAVLREVECLSELALRQLKSHRAAWRWLVLLNVLKCILKWVACREDVSKAMLTIRDFIAVSVVKGKGSRVVQHSGGLQRPLQQSNLVIPKVVSASGPTQSTGGSWSDVAAYAVDAFCFVRPLLLCLFAYRAFPGKRLAERMVYDASMPRLTTVQGLRSSLMPEWNVWRSFALAQVVALATSFVVRRMRAPVIVACDEPAHGEQQGDANETAPAPAVEQTEDDIRIQSLTSSLCYTVFQDPFFSVVLKQSVYNHLVEGRINRWIPLFGSLIANQVLYLLSMQHHSLLYTLQ